jgi:hypothetical protein
MKSHGSQITLLTLTAMAFALAPFLEANAMRVEIRATGFVRNMGNMAPYEKAIMAKVSEVSLAAGAAKDTKIEVIVDCHGNIADLNLTGSGLSADDSKALVDKVRTLKFSEAAPVESNDMEIKLTFDLHETTGGPVNYTGTSLKVGPGKGGAGISGPMVINGGSVTIGKPTAAPTQTASPGEPGDKSQADQK